MGDWWGVFRSLRSFGLNHFRHRHFSLLLGNLSTLAAFFIGQINDSTETPLEFLVVRFKLPLNPLVNLLIQCRNMLPTKWAVLLSRICLVGTIKTERTTTRGSAELRARLLANSTLLFCFNNPSDKSSDVSLRKRPIDSSRRRSLHWKKLLGLTFSHHRGSKRGL